MQVHLTILCFLTVLISPRLYCQGYSTEKWDYLVFTQTWPATKCIKSTYNSTESIQKCILPRNALEWTIHGLWPNKFDGNDPSFCNKSLPFDASKIRDIRKELEDVWPNLMDDGTVDSLWKHEWEKHGTCAVDLESLNNERKYFQKGLDLYAEYNMTALLPSLGIFPDRSKGYSAEHIFNVIRKALSKDPIVDCFHPRHDQPYYLSEIRICFDRSFQLIDCDPTYYDQGTRTYNTCPDGSSIIYPKNVNLDESY